MNPNQFSIDINATKEETDHLREKLKAYNQEQTHGQFNQPGIDIHLVLKNAKDEVLGGIIAVTMLHVMHLDVLWVAEEYRRRGFGKALVLAAEQIGLENGCKASHTWTFDFQGPDFYPKIGYQLIGVYDGYPGNRKEYVFKKELTENHNPTDNNTFVSDDFYITDRVPKQELEILHEGLRAYVDQYVGDEKKGIVVRLTAKDPSGNVVGGLFAWTTIHNLLIEVVWVDQEFRGLGLGKQLMMQAISIAKQKNNCIAALICPMSFHSPTFFIKMGFKEFGHSDGYPDPYKEHYMINKFTPKTLWQKLSILL